MAPTAKDATVEVLYALGYSLVEENRPVDAMHVFRTMLMGAPEDERSWLGLGLCHERVGQSEIARDLYQLAESALSSSFWCPLARARLARRQHAEDVAELAFELAEERARAADEPALAAAIAAERCAS